MQATELKFLYSKGCPKIEAAKVLLSDSGLGFDEVCMDDLRSSDRLKYYTSPTLLKNNRTIIFGSEVGPGGGCTVELPDSIEIKRRIENENW